jgi:hypothetical protein
VNTTADEESATRIQDVGGRDAELERDLCEAAEILRFYSQTVFTPRQEAKLKHLAERILEAKDRVVLSLAPGWICVCGVFNSDALVRLQACRCCGWQRGAKERA